MKIAIDTCSIIFLARASVLSRLFDAYEMIVTEEVNAEVMKGKERMFEDALLLEKLKKQRKFRIVKPDIKLMTKVKRDFNMGKGEASTIAAAIREKCFIATDNRQGRKAAEINELPLLGSPEIIVGLFKNKKIGYEKAFGALETLKKEQWFEDYLIENAMEDLK